MNGLVRAEYGNHHLLVFRASTDGKVLFRFSAGTHAACPRGCNEPIMVSAEELLAVVQEACDEAFARADTG
jgi:hypothetical protein